MISPAEEQLLQSRLVYCIDQHRITLLIEHSPAASLEALILRRFRPDQVLWWKAKTASQKESRIRECAIGLASVVREMASSSFDTFLWVVDPLPRSLASDVLWALLRHDIRNKERHLLLRCASLLQGQSILQALGGDEDAMILTWGPPRTPIPMAYLSQATPDFVSTMIETIFQIHVQYPTGGGDILGIVPSLGDQLDAILLQESQEYWDRVASNHPKVPRVDFVVLRYADGVPSSSSSRRRVYFTTPVVLEESLFQIPNIQFIVDSGWTDYDYFDTAAGMERSRRVPVDRNAALARASVATTGGGGAQYFGLYTLQEQEGAVSIPSHLARCNLTHFVFLCKCTPGMDLLYLLEKDMGPTVEGIQYALEMLYALGAVDENVELTDLGRQMGAFCFLVEPRIARMLLVAVSQEHASDDIVTLASLLQVLQDVPSAHVFRAKPKHVQQQKLDYEEAMAQLVDPSGDHVSYCNALADVSSHHSLDDICRERFLHAPTVRACFRLRSQLQPMVAAARRRLVESEARRFSGERSVRIRHCLLTGFFMNVAQLDRDGQYVLLRDGTTRIVPESSSIYHRYTKLTSAYICFTSSSADGTVHGVSVVEAQWLHEVMPQCYRSGNEASRV